MNEPDINCVTDLTAWLDEKIALLNSHDAEMRHQDWWIDAWSQAIGYAAALGFSADVDKLGGEIRQPTYAVSYEGNNQQVRRQVHQRLTGLRQVLTGQEAMSPGIAEPKLNETERSICEAIDRLWARGLEWPTAEDIAPEAGLEVQTVRNNVAPMARHGILVKGPSNQGYRRAFT